MTSAHTMKPSPLVSVLVVVRNGSQDIQGLFESLEQQDYAPLEVLVVDGMSQDGTRTLVKEYVPARPGISVRLLDNSGRIQATGWNIGIRAASGPYIFRIDAVHCRLQSRDYIRHCVETLIRLQETDPTVAATGGRRLSVTRTKGAWADAIALAQSCSFGVGNAGYRLSEQAGFTETLGVPLYDLRALRAVGLFDESLGRSEDNDLHARLRWRGFKLYYSPDVVALYHPRATLSGLASQMFHNGWWVSATIIRKRSFPFGVRHLIPFLFFLTLALLLGLSLSGFYPARLALALLLGAYLLGSLAAALQASRTVGFWRVATVFLIMHACYAAGTASGIFAGRSATADPGVVTAPGANLGS